ncbi:MarR family winged helix-turn-helix transcriptional regulator [Bacillus massilinigeriensis]|uniref:MarR family winged helix-turn-helix transcriptional regulator n=1 Tax=Bacillus massilionigeriensis TaxID=1805475 RepID=UPI00096B50B6|nr:MarR family transcriptional regulator [Bacillus massilionigeriensis]
MDPNQIDELINRYLRVSFTVNKRASTLIKGQIADDITDDQFNILRHIHQSGKVTSTELAEIFEVKKSAITAIITRLVDKGLITRTRDETDRRIVYLTLSKLGIEFFAKTEKKINCLVAMFLTRFEKEQIETFLKTYEKLSDILLEIKEDNLEEKE